MRRITPAALRALSWPTMPCDVARGSRASSRPRPRMCECAPVGRKHEFIYASWHTLSQRVGYLPTRSIRSRSLDSEGETEIGNDYGQRKVVWISHWHARVVKIVYHGWFMLGKRRNTRKQKQNSYVRLFGQVAQPNCSGSPSPSPPTSHITIDTSHGNKPKWTMQMINGWGLCAYLVTTSVLHPFML